MRRTLTVTKLALVGVSMYLGLGAGVVEATESPSATDRLLASQRASLRVAPQLVATRHEVDGSTAEALARASVGSPYLEWQSEGLGGSRRPNGQDTLRLGTPFQLPGQWAAARRLRSAADHSATAAKDLAALVTAAEVSRRWIDLAAAVARQEVVRQRLERLDEALSLQEAKYQLGEVAGTEVAQLDLEHVRETSLLARIGADIQAFHERLAELCGEACLEPLPADLEVLVTQTTTPNEQLVEPAAIERGVPYRSAEGATELAAAQSGLSESIAWGRPLVEAEWERIPEVEGEPGFDAWGIRLSIPLPIGGTGRHSRAAARAQAAAAQSRLEADRLEIASQARSALAIAYGAERRLSALRAALDTLPKVERSLSEQFRLGAISYLVYIDGLSRLDEVRLEAVEAWQQLLDARLELAVVLGDDAVFPLIEREVEDDP